MTKKHTFIGDRLLCPKTGKAKTNGIHSTGRNCDQCGDSIEELLDNKKIEPKDPLDRVAIEAVSEHCNAG